MFFANNEKETLTVEEKNLIRASAYTAIEKYNLTSLPANDKVFESLQNSKSYMIMSIQELAYFLNKDIEECFHFLGGQGSIYYDSDLNKYTIFYNRDIPNDLITWIIASLIAAVELDLVPYNKIFVINPDNEYLEEFASYFWRLTQCYMNVRFLLQEKFLMYAKFLLSMRFVKSKRLKKNIF